MTTRQESPRLSIGLAVFNGERYLREAIRAVLAQTYEDFELIISDNASSDRSEEICREFAVTDQRIRYYRNDINRGAAWNFNRVFELSSGEYFMWVAHDDKYTSQYASRCIEALEQNSSAVLCYTGAIDIDESGNHLRRKDRQNNSTSERPHERFRSLIRLDYTCEAIFGIIRSRILKKTALHGSYADSDRVLLAELALYGQFYLIPEYLFLHREHPLRSIRQFPSRRERSAWFNPLNAGKTFFPYFRQLVEFSCAVRRSPLDRKERLHCYLHLIRWMKDNRRRLASDVTYPVKRMLKRYLR